MRLWLAWGGPPGVWGLAYTKPGHGCHSTRSGAGEASASGARQGCDPQSAAGGREESTGSDMMEPNDGSALQSATSWYRPALSLRKVLRRLAGYNASRAKDLLLRSRQAKRPVGLQAVF